jgi:hypothetical protein
MACFVVVVDLAITKVQPEIRPEVTRKSENNDEIRVKAVIG